MSESVSRLRQEVWRLYRALARALLVKQLADHRRPRWPPPKPDDHGPGTG